MINNEEAPCLLSHRYGPVFHNWMGLQKNKNRRRYAIAARIVGTEAGNAAGLAGISWFSYTSISAHACPLVVRAVQVVARLR